MISQSFIQVKASVDFYYGCIEIFLKSYRYLREEDESTKTPSRQINAPNSVLRYQLDATKI